MEDSPKYPREKANARRLADQLISNVVSLGSHTLHCRFVNPSFGRHVVARRRKNSAMTTQMNGPAIAASARKSIH
jgi:hypothetical protein